MSFEFVDRDHDRDCVLLRIVLWERALFADSLDRFLRSSGRPFVRRPVGRLRPPSGAEGAVPFELFVLPIGTEHLTRLLDRSVSGPVACILSVDDFPMYSIMRRQPPRNPSEPHFEFLPYLKVLPTWDAVASTDLQSPESLRGSASFR
jgi:hypothetical protein